jgi:hypothetical protein
MASSPRPAVPVAAPTAGVNRRFDVDDTPEITGRAVETWDIETLRAFVHWTNGYCPDALTRFMDRRGLK